MKVFDKLDSHNNINNNNNLSNNNNNNKYNYQLNSKNRKKQLQHITLADDKLKQPDENQIIVRGLGTKYNKISRSRAESINYE